MKEKDKYVFECDWGEAHIGVDEDLDTALKIIT